MISEEDEEEALSTGEEPLGTQTAAGIRLLTSSITSVRRNLESKCSDEDQEMDEIETAHIIDCFTPS